MVTEGRGAGGAGTRVGALPGAPLHEAAARRVPASSSAEVSGGLVGETTGDHDISAPSSGTLSMGLGPGLLGWVSCCPRVDKVTSQVFDTRIRRLPQGAG